MSRRGRGNRGNRGRRTAAGRRNARNRARNRIKNIRNKPGKPTPAQQRRINKLKATIQANKGPARKPKPSPKPSPRPKNRPTNVGRGSFVSNRGRALTTAQVTQGNRPKATYNPGKRFTQSDVRQMRAGGMNRSQIQNAVNNFSGPVGKNVRNRFNVQPTATSGRGPLAPGATAAASSAFFANTSKPTFGVNSRGAKPIDQGGSVPSAMSSQYSGTTPNNFSHGDKFTKKDLKAMNDMGFTLEQKKDYIRRNNLADTKQGQNVLSRARGQFNKEGEYDYGLQFGKGDIRRLRQANYTNEQISNYINQQGIDNKIANRFLKRNPAQTPSDVGTQVTPPTTTTPTTPTTDPNAETSTPGFTLDPNQNLDPNPDPNSTDDSSTPPNLEGYTRNEDIQDMFDQYIKDAGLVPQNNVDPADLEVPEIEETAPYMGSIPTPKTTTESADPTWSTTGTGFTSSTMYPGGATNPWSFTPAFQPQPFTTQPVVKPETSIADTTEQPVAKTGSKEQAKEGTFDPSSYSKPTSQVGPDIVTANDFVKSGSPKIQPINPFTGVGYTLGTDGLPAYPNQIYGTGTALPGQLTPTGPVEGGYQPNVPAAPTPPTTPYHNQYAKDGLGYLPGQAGNPDGSFGLGIRPLTLKKENGQYVPMPLVAG